MSETASATANRTLRRTANTTYRPREYLTETESIDGAMVPGAPQRSYWRIGMVSARQSCVSFVGRKSI
jgi:hypothetical protein